MIDQASGLRQLLRQQTERPTDAARAQPSLIAATGGKTYDAAGDFSIEKNPNGPWSYGQFAPGAKPDPSTFAPYPKAVVVKGIGTLSNPGSTVWEDVLSDQHPYRRVPHTAEIIHELRTLEGNGLPLFISEYGIGSAIDLLRVVRRYEQLGKPDVEDAQFYRIQRDHRKSRTPENLYRRNQRYPVRHR